MLSVTFLSCHSVKQDTHLWLPHARLNCVGDATYTDECSSNNFHSYRRCWRRDVAEVAAAGETFDYEKPPASFVAAAKSIKIIGCSVECDCDCVCSATVPQCNCATVPQCNIETPNATLTTATTMALEFCWSFSLTWIAADLLSRWGRQGEPERERERERAHRRI